MTRWHLWQGTHSAHHLGVLRVTRRIYEQILVHGACWIQEQEAGEV